MFFRFSIAVLPKASDQFLLVPGKQGLHCQEEVHCTDENGSTRFIDIVANDHNSSQAFIVDPTIRYETNSDIGKEVQEEKERLYAGCANSLNAKFSSRFGHRDYQVIGLWMGARGTVSKGLSNFFSNFRLGKMILPELAEEVLVASIRMLHHHINGPDEAC